MFRKIVWQSKKCGWNWLAITYGKRRSTVLQLFPFLNSSNNSTRAIMIGLHLWFIEIAYHKKGKSFQNKRIARFLPFKHRLWRFYNLIF